MFQSKRLIVGAVMVCSLTITVNPGNVFAEGIPQKLDGIQETLDNQVILQLDETEPRIPISSLSFTIETPGSYYLTENLTATGNGITVEADDVTIDLMGYSVIGSGSGYGIYMYRCSNVEVRNGTVREFEIGIYEFWGENHRVINARAVGNVFHGIWLKGFGHLVKDCTASDNGDLGILAAGAVVTGNTVRNNDGMGMSVSASTVTGNTAYKNGSYGIYVSSCSVTGNTACNNGADGIHTSNHCTLTGNTACGNGGSGIYAFAGCTVTGNTADFNQKYGIELYGWSLVDGNTAHNNDQSGGGYANISPCDPSRPCTFGLNHNLP